MELAIVILVGTIGLSLLVTALLNTKRKPEPEPKKPESNPAPTWRSSETVQSYRRVGDYGPSYDGPSYPSVKYHEPKNTSLERTNKTPTWRECPEPSSAEPGDKDGDDC